MNNGDLRFTNSRPISFREELRTAAERTDDETLSDLLLTIASSSQLGSPAFCAALRLARSMNEKDKVKDS